MHGNERRAIAFAGAGVFVAALLTGCPPETGVSRGSAEAGVLRLANLERAKAGLVPLDLRDDLSRIAREHSRAMVETGALEHRSEHDLVTSGLFGKTRVEWARIGENVARVKGYDDPAAEAMRGWLNSPGHRKNLLAQEFRETGIGVATDPESGFVYFTQIFVQPMRAQ